MSSISVVHHPFSDSMSDQNSPFSFPYTSTEHGQEGSQPASATFTINPASSRPPSTAASLNLKARTPKTSLIGSNADRPGSVFDMPSFGAPSIHEKDENSAPSFPISRRSKAVRAIEVWREMFSSSNGRDKALKLIQYSIRVYLFFHLRSSKYIRRQPQKAWEADMITGLGKAYAGLSLSRKCMIMFNWLAPLSTISAPDSLPSSKGPGRPKQQPLLRKLLHSPPPVLLDLLCGLADDLATFYKLGLVPQRIGQRAESLADWCWFSGTLVDLVEVGVELSVVGGAISEIEGRLYRESMSTPGAATTSGQATDEVELTKLRRQQYWSRVQQLKLFMDLIFVSYDVFHLKKYSDAVKSFSGLASAVLSSMKLYDKHHGTLSRSVV
ncbi:hypothetical protein M408DRAFT_330017 [Serendipita vermifera MAFF 305830]|uniref:Uncharacterized protein n=1 Tax=Serendipita vermifera MAFF 305830 TaxID=933852 RepID=A0A0C3ASR0_SERVB|nr:hypothetical protein M408DRAFT_330017 [Serendipita vermifera MAFF 305830]